MDDHDPDALQFAQCEYRLRAQAQPPILVRDHQPPNLPPGNRIPQPLQALLPMVQAGPKVTDRLGPPALRCAIGFQRGLLPVRIRLLIVTGHTRMAQGRRGFVGCAKQVRHRMVARAGSNSPVRSHFRSVTGLVPSIRAASPIFTNRPRSLMTVSEARIRLDQVLAHCSYPEQEWMADRVG